LIHHPGIYEGIWAALLLCGHLHSCDSSRTGYTQ
jgi:hypothetical protein